MLPIEVEVAGTICDAGCSSSVNVTSEKCVVCDLTGLDRGKIAFYRLIQNTRLVH